MKKTFKWLLFSTLVASISAVIVMLSIYLPNFINWANYSTADDAVTYNHFITYDEDTYEVVKTVEDGTPKYTLNVRLYNLSNKDQTLTFRFWFTCRDDFGIYSDCIDKEITIPKPKNSYEPGQIDYSCELVYFSHCSDVYIGAEVSVENISNISSSSSGFYWADNVLINKDGFREIDGFKVTTKNDMCEAITPSYKKMRTFDRNWQESFNGVILALSICGGIFVVCLVFTVILLLPDKKKKIEVEKENNNIN